MALGGSTVSSDRFCLWSDDQTRTKSARRDASTRHDAIGGGAIVERLFASAWLMGVECNIGCCTCRSIFIDYSHIDRRRRRQQRRWELLAKTARGATGRRLTSFSYCSDGWTGGETTPATCDGCRWRVHRTRLSFPHFPIGRRTMPVKIARRSRHDGPWFIGRSVGAAKLCRSLLIDAQLSFLHSAWLLLIVLLFTLVPDAACRPRFQSITVLLLFLCVCVCVCVCAS